MSEEPRFHDPRLSGKHEGKTELRVGHVKGRVVLRFKSAVTCIGMTPAQAIQIAEALLRHARRVAGAPPGAELH